MTIRLSLRKRFKKLMVNSKGFSSVIGTTFMVLVMMFLSTSVFLWTLSQNTMYNEAVRARNQEEAERSSENIVALTGNYSVSGSEVTVNVVLKNVGSVAVQIINLWVLDSDPSNRRYTNKSLNLNLKSGDVLNLVGSSGLKVTIPGADPSHIFTSWFVTAKGNTIPLEKELGVIVAQLAQGIGSMALDFETFGYFTYETTTKLANYPTGNVSFNIPKNEYVAFRVRLTNLDPRKQSITLDSHSLFWQPGRPAVSEGAWFIVNVRDDGTIISIDKGTYSPITIPYTETVTVIFASQNDLRLGSFSRLRTPNVDTTVAVFLLLHGTIGTSPYAQNIPFVSIFYQSLS